MAAKSASDDGPQLIDRGRWEGEVVGSTSYTFEWGTYAFDARIRAFADGEGYVEVVAPGEPPLCAREIVTDALDGGPADAAIGALLAREWGIDIEEVPA